MSLRRSRGIHAARPTPRRLRSACTQVAIGVVWTIAYEDQDQDQDQVQWQRQSPRAVNAEPVAVRLAGGGVRKIATAGKPDCYRGVCVAEILGLNTNPSDVSPRDRIRTTDHCSLLILLLSARKSRRHKSRLGCRPNAGGAPWAERHGCRESRPPPWMADGGGPTERRRSEGIPTKEEPNQEQGLFGYFFGSWKK